MLKFINKIPAGMFIVPMVISMVLNTFFPELFRVGGSTQALFSSDGISFMIAFLVFASGVSIKISDLPALLKRHGILLLAKLIITTVLAILYMRLFGQEGILGISAMAFTLVMTSINPSVYLSIVDEYGDNLDPAAFGIIGLFPIPLIPQIIYSIGYTEGGAGGSFDFMPIITTLIPLILGIILGNLEPGFRNVFSPGVGAILPVLGWQIGQTANIIDALRSGLPGLIMVAFYLLVFSSLYFIDRYLLKNNGITGLAMMIVAGTSASSGATLTATYPELLPYLGNTVGIIVFSFIVSSLVMPTIISRYYKRLSNTTDGEEAELAEE